MLSLPNPLARLLTGVLLGGVVLAPVLAQDELVPVLPSDTEAESTPESTPDRREPPPLSPRIQQAMIAYAQGAAALQSGDSEQAIEHLKQAIRLKPDDAQFHYQLSRAYAATDDQALRWYALRQAVRLNPGHGQAVSDFEQMWSVALDQDALDVDTPRERIQAALGEPDQTSDDRNTWVYGYRAIQFEDDRLHTLLDLRGQGALQPATEVFSFDFDQRDWRLKQRLVSRTESTLIYTPEDQGETDEQITLQRLVDMKTERSPQQIMNDMRAHLQNQFPTVEWVVHHATDDDVLFEWTLSGEGLPTQHEIVRLAAGEEDVYRLSYTSKHIDPDKGWRERLGRAELQPL
jgi:hypothetical protein